MAIRSWNLLSNRADREDGAADLSGVFRLTVTA